MDSDVSSRVLVVAATLEKGQAFLERLKLISANSITSTTSSDSVEASFTPAIVPQPLTIPWRITNRYYTADIHFHLVTTETITRSKTGVPNVPAVVYVFRQGEKEEFKKEATLLARVMKLDEDEGRHEVVLGVRLEAAADNKEALAAAGGIDEEQKDEESEDEDENADIDSTLLGLGFEYVDGTRNADVDPLSKRTAGSGEADSIPALPRVLDALSTIMWPSMRSTSSKGGLKSGRSIDFNGSFDLDDADVDLEEEQEAMMAELLKSTAGVSLDPAADDGGDAEEKELIEQMKAYLQDAGKKNQPHKPWISTTGTATRSEEGLSMSPTGVAGEGDDDLLTPFGKGTGDKTLRTKVSLRFDDDFTAFVEAPAFSSDGKQRKKPGILDDLGKTNDTLQWDTNMTPTILPSGYATAAGLTPDRDDSFSRYQALDSVSDFGDTSDQRLYQALGDSDGVDSEDEDLPSEVADAARKIYGSKGDGFDLDRTFGMLQQMKSEIGNIQDDEERRKTAARVALGVAYGVE